MSCCRRRSTARSTIVFPTCGCDGRRCLSSSPARAACCVPARRTGEPRRSLRRGPTRWPSRSRRRLNHLAFCAGTPPRPLRGHPSSKRRGDLLLPPFQGGVAPNVTGWFALESFTRHEPPAAELAFVEQPDKERISFVPSAEMLDPKLAHSVRFEAAIHCEALNQNLSPVVAQIVPVDDSAAALV